ncbi:ultraviolet-B receptor UVR8 isoform X2 [Strongylocentrotus purpuratus]|uniref:RCC1-like domain-containing protein n=1 Tax=Strongylocentrotus purpuratus TaxID=7668 RepID=A0A7M7N8X0_STRPU|nr:ultraviolet-B receptor UVR8 isoform X2 [Strongylocentrotus purpuratus]
MPQLDDMDDMDDLTSMSKVTDLDQDRGLLLSWGCGEFGQHGHGGSGENVSSEGALVDHGDSLVRSHRVKHISCGSSHTAVVTGQDEVLTWGNGNSGQLGCGDKATHTSPQRLRLGPHDSQVAGVACGSRHTVVWLENGRAYSCGNNFYVQLGYDFRVKNYKENQVLPHFLRPIMHRKVVQVSCGKKFTLFLFESGQVAGCGANNFGQLGNGTRAEMVSPKPLDNPENVIRIAAGSCHSLAVTATGELYAWGMGRACGSRRDDLLTPQRKTTRRSNVVGVAGGSGHSLALTGELCIYLVKKIP